MLTYEISGGDKFTINDKLIKKSVRSFGASAGLSGSKSFSLAFVDGPTIRKFNRSYRGKDKITDVLSFAERDSEVIMPGEAAELGEILICLSQAKRQAKEYGWSLDYEVIRLLVHGLAHLIGYEHEGVSKKEEARMFRFEWEVMEKIFGNADNEQKKCSSCSCQ